eukprot:2537694-Pyramimonas_sp.AAC.1
MPGVRRGGRGRASAGRGQACAGLCSRPAQEGWAASPRVPLHPSASEERYKINFFAVGDTCPWAAG